MAQFINKLLSIAGGGTLSWLLTFYPDAKLAIILRYSVSKAQILIVRDTNKSWLETKQRCLLNRTFFRAANEL